MNVFNNLLNTLFFLKHRSGRNYIKKITRIFNLARTVVKYGLLGK